MRNRGRRLFRPRLVSSSTTPSVNNSLNCLPLNSSKLNKITIVNRRQVNRRLKKCPLKLGRESIKYIINKKISSKIE